MVGRYDVIVISRARGIYAIYGLLQTWTVDSGLDRGLDCGLKCACAIVTAFVVGGGVEAELAGKYLCCEGTCE